MKAVRVRQWGGHEATRLEEVERPQPAAGEVLVRVKAASVNPVDWQIREGYMHEFVTLPFTLGSDVAGDIEALGEGVEGLEIGAPIYGMNALRGGSFAEFTIMKPSDFAPKPKSLSYKEAAAVPHAALVAWQSLFDVGKVSSGQRVLVHGAAGGVGHYAVQFAKLKGAHVIGTGSASSETFIRELGADEFVDYNITPFETVVKDMDMVLDTVGYDTTARSGAVLKRGGTLVCLVYQPMPESLAQYGITSLVYGAHADTEDLTEIASLIDDGKVKPHISQIVSLDLAHEALALSQARHIRGKVVISIEE